MYRYHHHRYYFSPCRNYEVHGWSCITQRRERMWSCVLYSQGRSSKLQVFYLFFTYIQCSTFVANFCSMNNVGLPRASGYGWWNLLPDGQTGHEQSE